MSKKNTIYVASGLLLLALLVTPACDWFKKKTEEAKELVSPRYHLLDANSEEIYRDARLPGAVNVSFDKIEEQSKGWDKKTPVVVYCSSYDCTESHRVARELKKLGFEDVAVYAGGTNEWHKLSKENKVAYALEGEAKQSYLQKVIAKIAPKEEDGIRTITAEELSKLIEGAKAPEKAA
jgi:rhodanese-related sulfurtransferase